MKTASLGVIATGSALLLSCSPGVSGERLYYELKGIPAIQYIGIFKATGPCGVDQKAWDTAIRFVANQSTKLKLVTFQDHNEHFNEFINRQKAPKKTTSWTDEDNRKAIEEKAQFDKELFVPSLYVSITTIDVKNGCAAFIEASVNVNLQRSAIIPTGVTIANPTHEVWSASWTLKDTYQSFSKSAIELSEQLVKSLVNDWTASQDL
jgi:hypothetical protein